MVDLSILTTDPVVPDPLVLPSQAMLETIQADAETSSLYSFLPEGSVDIATWSPSMWWLLNWLTWQFPPPSTQSESGSNELVMYVVQYTISRSDGHDYPIGPTLSAMPAHDDDGPGPPQMHATVRHTINMGNGLLDLFA